MSIVDFMGGPKPPKYEMSPQHRELTYENLYPKLQEIIKSGGMSYDTAGMKRSAAENIASQYGGAFKKVRSLLPYGNPGSMNRMNLDIATRQARDTSTAMTGLESDAERYKLNSLMSILGLSSGLQDPNLAQYYADMQRYGAGQQRHQGLASMLGGITTLGVMPFLSPAAAGTSMAANTAIPHADFSQYLM